MIIPTYYFTLKEDLEKEKDYQFLPTKSETKATGWDVRLYTSDKKDVILRSGQKALLQLGFRSFCEDGWWYAIYPRSSTFHKKALHCLYGVIDETWEGYTAFSCQYIPDVNSLGKDLVISYGEPIAQLIPVKRQEMNVKLLTNEEIELKYKERKGQRGNKGFGGMGG